MEPRGRNQSDELNVGPWVDDQLAGIGPGGEWEPDVQRGLRLLREQRRPKHSRAWGWIAAGSLAACITLVATPVTRAFAQRCLAACVGESNVLLGNTAPGVVPSNVYVKPDRRSLAPDFTLNDLTGAPLRLSNYRGKVVLLNFWATWCAPCKAEIPALIDLEHAYRDRGFAVLGISLDEGGSNIVQRYVEALHVNYPVARANDKIPDLFGGLKAVPTTFIIDRLGRIAATHVGLCQRSEYESDIQTLLSE